jgi:hypothetical protein
MGAGGCSAFFKVGPNDSEPNHEPGRGQIKGGKEPQARVKTRLYEQRLAGLGRRVKAAEGAQR